MHFQLREGKHTGPTTVEVIDGREVYHPGKLYLPGDIIKTDDDLGAKFGNHKFERLADDDDEPDTPGKSASQKRKEKHEKRMAALDKEQAEFEAETAAE